MSRGVFISTTTAPSSALWHHRNSTTELVSCVTGPRGIRRFERRVNVKAKECRNIGNNFANANYAHYRQQFRSSRSSVIEVKSSTSRWALTNDTAAPRPCTVRPCSVSTDNVLRCLVFRGIEVDFYRHDMDRVSLLSHLHKYVLFNKLLIFLSF